MGSVQVQSCSDHCTVTTTWITAICGLIVTLHISFDNIDGIHYYPRCYPCTCPSDQSRGCSVSVAVPLVDALSNGPICDEVCGYGWHIPESGDDGALVESGQTLRRVNISASLDGAREVGVVAVDVHRRGITGGDSLHGTLDHFRWDQHYQLAQSSRHTS